MKELSPELVAIAIEAFNREGGKRAASPFLWTIAEPQMKAALTAALPLLEEEIRRDEREKVLREFLDEAVQYEKRDWVDACISAFARERYALDLTQHSQKVDP